MKKHLSLIVRVLLAAAGLTYITLSLTWTDHVRVPAGFVYPDGVVETQDNARHRVVDINDRRIAVSRSGENGALTRVEIPRSQLDRGEGSPEYHESIIRTLRGANWMPLLWGLAAVGTIYPIQVVRWMILMRCRGMEVAWGRAFRLTMVGAFFNLCMPGTTGGDVLKAYYAAKRSEMRGAAVVSVIFDRLTGLFGLVVFAGVAGLFIMDHPAGRRITMYIWLGIVGVVILSALYFSRRIREVVGVNALLRKLPHEHLINRLDRTVGAYSHHKTAVLMAVLVSLPVQLALSWAAAMAGYALGIDPTKAPLLLLMVVTPVVFLVGAIPLTFQGVGTMEWTAQRLLEGTGAASFNQIVGMLLLSRLFLVFYSLFGSIYLLRGDIHLQEIKQIDVEALEAQADAETAAGDPKEA